MEKEVNINIHLMPFGEIRLRINQAKEDMSEEEKTPIYIEPSTTNVERVEILYEGGEEYKDPETTDGR